MHKVMAVLLVVVSILLMLALVTPWLVNQDSTLTLISIPFVWVLFAYGAAGFLKRVMR